ncbi:MAG: multiple sugar transport system substrate-binding protein [Clostridium sp.]|jgi:multiple sugar transport system substrate-binding protein
MIKKIFIMILVLVFLTSCSDENLITDKNVPIKGVTSENATLSNMNFENIELPKNYNIRQFDGMTLNFIVEKNLNANILSQESEEFSRLTGINVKVRAYDYDTFVQKINLDFIAQTGKYPLVYVDPYQTLNRFYKYLEVLNPYNEDITLPKIKGFTEDFFENQTTICSNFINNKDLYSVPFDSTTMILYYRKDIFDKYRSKFYKDKGYDWTPGTSNFTWDKYCEVSEWIDNNVPDEEVKYGCGLMAQAHNSIFCEFSNILASYGGDYFSDKNINTLGLKTFDKINVLDKKFVKALDVYKKISKVAAPESVNWNWTDLANAFYNGDIAMMANWDENSTYLEDTGHSKVAGKVGYSILPYGDVKSANIYGGSGIGINKYTSEKEKNAAWLYIVWATSKEMQLKVFTHPEGGSLPTRKSVYNDPQIRNKIQDSVMNSEYDVLINHMNAVINAWKPENIYLRPKIANFYDVEKVLCSNLHDMIRFNLNSKKTGLKIYDELEKIKDEK